MRANLTFVLLIGLSSAASSRPPAARPRVVLDEPSLLRSASKDQAAVLTQVVALTDAWVAGDAAEYGALLAPSVTRMAEEAGAILRGREAVLAALASERSQFEQPGGELELALRIGHLDVDVRGDVATVTYDVAVSGRGRSRWEFDDRWAVFQVFERHAGGVWRLVHQSDAANLDDADSEEVPFDFDFVYPVANLARAVAFYEAWLGKPEYVTRSRAAFAFGVPRFILDTETRDGLATVRDGLPNGYAVIYVDDLEATSVQLAAKGVAFVSPIRPRGLDLERVALDPAGNVLVFAERRFRSDADGAPVFTPPPRAPRAAMDMLSAWLAADRRALSKALAPDAVWFDDTRTHRATMARRPSSAVVNSVATDWRRFDRGPRGLAVRASIDELHVESFGELELVRYRRVLSSDGAHPFRDVALVTHVLDRGRVALTFAARANEGRRLARGLDYTGYPVQDLAAARRFYRDTLALGEPYADESYYGFWSTHSVFGIYESDPDDDGIPRRSAANGYVCFWVDSAQEAYAQLRKQGARFPAIGSITDTAGVDAQPGYTQVLATDSEGNALIFGEYTGR